VAGGIDLSYDLAFEAFVSARNPRTLYECHSTTRTLADIKVP
jgi:hypothetical protein